MGSIAVGHLDPNPRREKTLYERESEQYFIPASNVKLLTTAAILLKMGGDFRFKTPIYREDTAPQVSRLWLVGKGDPSLTREQLNQLAQTLKNQGIKTIQSLIVQDSSLNTQWLNPSWEWSDLAFYFASPVSQINLDRNQVTLQLVPTAIAKPLRVNWSNAIAAQQWQVINQTITTPARTANNTEILPVFGESTLVLGGQLAVDAAIDETNIAIPNPSRYFLDTLQAILKEKDIIINQSQVSQRADLPATMPFTVIESLPLRELIAQTNQDSINLYAEAFLNLLATTDPAPQEHNRFVPLKAELQKLGLDPNSFQLADGSGLSRQNLVPPAVFVKLLQRIARTPYAQDFRQSLAIAGQSGTLASFSKNTPLVGKIQAKSGTLTGVSALSGYFTPDRYSALVFSLILNQSDRSAASSRQAIQDILLTLNRLEPCQDS
jgi:D-alanyl-D-alanine carboxypeptidase/D-alanyl-D-alanine-endopeptidase (penicillin-binding protein 4)